MKKFLAILLCVLSITTASLALTQHAQAANPMTGNIAKVTFTFDDGFASAYTRAAPILAKYGFVGTSYPITGCVGVTRASTKCPSDVVLTEKPSFMTWAQITALQNTYKWEVGSHTNSHPAMTTLTAAQVTAELTTSKQALVNHGITTQAYCSPYGDYNNSVLSAVAKQYGSHRGFADVGYNRFPYNDYLLYVQPVQVGVSVAQVKSYIDYAKANNLWLILAFHHISPTPSIDPEDYQYKTTDLDSIAAYVKQQALPVTTISQALVPTQSNLMPNASFDNGLSDGWTTDSPASVIKDSANNGSHPNATNSLKITSSTKSVHVFSPKVAVSSTQQYVVKSFLNLSQISSGVVGYYVDEYDSAGNWISGQYKKQESAAFVEDMNFVYQPSSAQVTQASLQIFTTASSGVRAYVDNVLWIGDAPVVPPPPPATNMLSNPDFDLGLTNGWATDAITNIVADALGHGVAPSATSSISLSSDSTKNVHLFGPQLAVEPLASYTISSYLNITQMTSGVIGFYIDEYDSAGNWISGQYKAERAGVSAGTVSYGYQPSSGNVAKASIQVIVVANSGIQAYLDHATWTKN